MEIAITGIITAYVALLIYVFVSFRRFLQIPLNERKKMTYTQRMLALYGFYRPPSKDIQNQAGGALTNFHKAWENMQDVFRQFEGTFESRRQELQKAEENLAKLEQEIKERDERLRAQRELTPAAAHEVELFVEKSGKSALRQQFIVSAVFFVLGCAVTLSITMLIK